MTAVLCSAVPHKREGPQNTLGTMISRLRRERGMSQSDLAVAAKCDEQTIGSIERGAERRWRFTTARLILIALDQAAPIPADDRAKLEELTGVRMPPAAPAPLPRPVESPVDQLLEDAIDVAGEGPVMAALSAIIASFRAREAGPTKRPVTVYHPPKQRGDRVEQEIVEYVVEDPPTERPAQRRQDRGGAAG